MHNRTSDTSGGFNDAATLALMPCNDEINSAAVENEALLDDMNGDAEDDSSCRLRAEEKEEDDGKDDCCFC
jgi:hypothetical protein